MKSPITNRDSQQSRDVFEQNSISIHFRSLISWYPTCKVVLETECAYE